MIIIVKLYWVFTIFRILFIHEFVPLIFIRPYEITVLFPLYRRGKWRHRELSNLFRQEWVDPGPPRWSWASPWVVGAQISWLTLGSEWSDVWHWGTGNHSWEPCAETQIHTRAPGSEQFGGKPPWGRLAPEVNQGPACPGRWGLVTLVYFSF